MVSGVTWTSFTSSYTVVVWGVGKGWDRYRLGYPAVEVLAPHLRLMHSQATVMS